MRQFNVKNRVIGGAILNACNNYHYDDPSIVLTGHSSTLSLKSIVRLNEFIESQLEAYITGEKELLYKIPLK